MKRRKPLGADPEKVRAFQQRGRGSLSRSQDRTGAQRPIQRAKAQLRQTSRKRRRRIPERIRKAVRHRQDGKCIVPGCKGRASHAHHVLPVQKFPELELEADNIVLACPQCHMDHEFAPDGRLLRSWLPDCSLALARRIGARAEAYIERTYPT